MGRWTHGTFILIATPQGCKHI